MLTHHKIILGNSQYMSELADGSVQLMVTTPPYPMIKMWDSLFVQADPIIAVMAKTKRGLQGTNSHGNLRRHALLFG